MSDSVRPHRLQPTRLPCPWDSPGKNTRVGCHFLLQCMKGKSESEVAQSCPTLHNLMDCSLSGFLGPWNFPGKSTGVGCNFLHQQCRRPGFNPWVQKIPWKREWQPAPVFLLGKSHGQRSLVGYSTWDHNELNTTEQLTLLNFLLFIMIHSGSVYPFTGVSRLYFSF